MISLGSAEPRVILQGRHTTFAAGVDIFLAKVVKPFEGEGVPGLHRKGRRQEPLVLNLREFARGATVEQVRTLLETVKNPDIAHEVCGGDERGR